MADLRKILEPPKTLTRMKHLADVYVSFGGYDPSQGTPDFAALTYLTALTRVGISIKRGAKERRELNSANLGKIIEMIPGLVDFEGCELSYIWQYKQGSLIEACGFGGTTLEYQTQPLFLLIVFPAPNAADVRKIVLSDVWFKENPIEVSVEDKDDLRLVQKVPIAVGGIYEV